MKDFISLLVIGFILIGIGCGLMLDQISKGGIDLKPISDFIVEISNFELIIEGNRLEFKRPASN